VIVRSIEVLVVNSEFRERLSASLCVSSLLGFTIFFFGPTHIYFTNILEYSTPFLAILPSLLGFSVLCVVLLTGVLQLMRPSFHKRSIALILSISLLLWIQGNVLVWDYGPLDGGAIDWNSNIANGLIDGAVWITFILIILAASTHVWRSARGVSLAFILVQLISLLVVVVRVPDASYAQKKALVSEGDIYQYSSKKNVIILVLDMFQGDIFQEIINEDSQYRELFNGFTYYRNALGGYPFTDASVPLILSGRYYEHTSPMREFRREVFSSESVPKILKENGFQVDLIVNENRIYIDETIASNQLWFIGSAKPGVADVVSLLDITLFRYLPHFAKKYVYSDQSWLLGNSRLARALGAAPTGYHKSSIEFIRKMTRQAKFDSNRYVFKYIHLGISHLPIRVNERLEYVRLEYNRHNFKEQAKGALKLVNILLEKLRSAGAYDNTMIFVISDHGCKFKVAVDESGYAESGKNISGKMEKVKAKALCLFLVKPFMSRGDLKVSDAPVSLGDIAKTIVCELDLAAAVPGSSIFKVDESDIRDRRFFFHAYDREQAFSYFSPMEEYVVSGFSWLNESWSQTFKKYTSEGVKDSSGRYYEYGADIKFGKKGDYRIYEKTGWDLPGRGFTWTNGTSASLVIPIRKTEMDVELRAIFSPFIAPGKLDRQRVNVFVNGNRVAAWEAKRTGIIQNKFKRKDASQTKTVIIPKKMLADDKMVLTFELPDAASPTELGVGNDARTLGICMFSLTLTESKSGSGT